MAGFSIYVRRLQNAPFLHRVRKLLAYYGHGLYQQLMHKDIFLWSQAIAFKVLITIVPIIIMATGVLGQVLQRPKPFETVDTFLRTFLPPANSGQITDALTTLANAGDLFTIIGVLGLLFSAVTLFTTLRVTVGNVFQEEWHEDRSILGGYLFDARMVVQVGLFFILTFGLTLAVRTLNTAGFEFIEKIGLDYVWIREGWRRAINTLGLIIPFLLTTAMFFQLFYFVPKPHPPKRSAFVGALFTAVLWEGAKSGFAVYAASIGRFDRYTQIGAEDARAYLGNTFGLIIAFVFWVYFSGVVLLLGAIVALLHEKAHRSRRAAALAEAARRAAAAPEDDAPEAEEIFSATPLLHADDAPAAEGAAAAPQAAAQEQPEHNCPAEDTGAAPPAAEEPEAPPPQEQAKENLSVP